ncbi:hypothetical protein Psfp_03940 [Pelotomaculum sp. FP]|uniref:hypothetical protein n=1 Tax=Pelotomaculum sp. FP TaxID=261474 RepID=UPI0010661E61|nr:hypothetical protein [Pelotomaculum sp. FP]TEB11514.1 hypothetical protein Psfp_03940 [Pelotomaculum sp. FP]
MKSWKAKVVSAALALSVLAPSAAFAADNTTATDDVQFKPGFVSHLRFGGAKNQLDDSKILEVVGKYAPESLSDWESVIAEREQLANALKEKAPAGLQKTQLSDEQKEQIKNIREQMKDGTLTAEQAKEQLQGLGLDMGRSFGLKTQLTDEQKEQINDIREQVENGTLTAEQAKEQLQGLGLDMVRAFAPNIQLTDEQKEQIKNIREQMKDGALTAEQAKEQLQSLGLPGKSDFIRPGNLMGQLNEAVEANDESKIVELLPQLLEQLQERNQQLSDKLSEMNQ